jgi:uncharacterized membrane protein YdbT with pleckstrin-like domain
MPSYIQQTLLTKEKLLHLTRPHWVIFLMPLVLMLFAWVLPAVPPFIDMIARIILLFGIIRAIRAVIFYYTSEYGITNKRVLIKMGWIRRTSLEIYLNRVESIKINQSILGRFLNYGSIRVIGMGGSSDEFSFVPDPVQFRHNVQEAVSERLAAGGHRE